MTKLPKLPFWEETPNLASFSLSWLYFKALGLRWGVASASSVCGLQLRMPLECNAPWPGPKADTSPITLRWHQFPLPVLDFLPCFCSQTEFPILFEASPGTCFFVFVLGGGHAHVSSSSHPNRALKLDFHNIKSAFYYLKYRNVFCHWV